MRERTKERLGIAALVLIPVTLLGFVIYKASTADVGGADGWWMDLTASEQRGFIALLLIFILVDRPRK